jgi:PHP family Zn ribbon phosphoesterase
MGSRDRLERIADRTEPALPADAPAFRELLPLRQLLARTCRTKADSRAVERLYTPLIKELGNERYILTRSPEEELRRAALAPAIGEAILAQRAAGHRFFSTEKRKAAPAEVQSTLLGF